MSAIEDRLWEAGEPTLYITKDEFLKSLEGWEIQPIEISGDLAFVFLIKESALHFFSLGTGHRLTMKIIRQVFQPLLDKHGFVTTKTPKDDERQHRFNAMMGWEITGEDEFDTHFRIERLPHG